MKLNPDWVIFKVTSKSKVVFWGVLSHAGTDGMGFLEGQFVNCKRVWVDENLERVERLVAQSTPSLLSTCSSYLILLPM